MDRRSPRALDAPERTSPPESVLRAWNVDEVHRLPGGQGEAFRSEHLMFKPAPEPARSAWLADALETLAPDGEIRIVRSERSFGGAWVVDGWAAWQWLEGEPWAATLPELLDVSARFHAAVADLPWASAMVGHDRWAVADRIAWGEADHVDLGSLQSLGDARRPIPLTCQLVHGDLAGNVLSHPGMRYAVIDISPYWRPRALADAIIVVDQAVCGPPDEPLVPDVLGPHGRQLLIRAALFRALSDPQPTYAYDPVIEQLLDQK